MISGLTVTNFKSIGTATFRLADITLFSGTNSSGKSSAIQALLLASDNLEQAVGERKMRSTFFPAISFNESRNYITNAKEYNVAIESRDHTVGLSFTPLNDNFIATAVSQKGVLPPDGFNEVKRVFHLAAMRSADLGSPRINPDADTNPLGVNGEYIIDYYYGHLKDILPDELVNYKGIRTLEGQVNYWLRQLTDYTVEVTFNGTEYVVRYISPEGKSLHPYNVGTGVNFICQTLIVCLAAGIGSTVIVENPEIHLHPGAQAHMLDFLVKVAGAGVQIIIESHSDHIFNGLRRSLKAGVIPVEKVSVYNFTKNGGLTEPRPVRLSRFGGIENYVPGMFDQFDRDLDEILM